MKCQDTSRSGSHGIGSRSVPSHGGLTPENEKENISHGLLVETILNYGDMEAVKQLFNVMGLQNVAKVFWGSINSSERKRGNYHELVLNYFTLYFERHAS